MSPPATGSGSRWVRLDVQRYDTWLLERGRRDACNLRARLSIASLECQLVFVVRQPLVARGRWHRPDMVILLATEGSYMEFSGGLQVSR